MSSFRSFLRLMPYAERAAFVYVLFHISRTIYRQGFGGSLRAVLSIIIKTARVLPGVGGVVNKEIQKEIDNIEKKVLGTGDAEANVKLPAEGLQHTAILDTAARLKKIDNFESGKKWAGIYSKLDTTEPVKELQSKMWAMFNNANSLYPGIFKSCRKFEAEIIRMVLSLVHGGPDASGLLTSGGTESILIAILAYRGMARGRGIIQPEIITSFSCHGALDKACYYFGLKLVKLQPDPVTFALRPEEVKGSINSNTIAIYASAPSFPHGVVDPIGELGQIAMENSIGLHVDNCLGGFLLSFLQQHGLFKRQFDFKVPGVTSMSVDVHKYGYSPKGVSVVAFSSRQLRDHSIHPVTDGMTLYVTPTLQGSRGGAVIAAAWATLMSVGENGYLAAAERLNTMKERVQDEVKSIEGLTLPVISDLAIVPIGSEEFDIYQVATLMERRGWSMFTSSNPPLMSLCLGESHHTLLDDWFKDLRECVIELRKNPSIKIEGDAAVYGAAKLLPQDVLQEVMKGYIDIVLRVKPK